MTDERRLESKATLRVLGHSLVPASVTKLLGCEPSEECEKGELWLRPNGKEVRARTGHWQLNAPVFQEALDCDQLSLQIDWLLSQCSDDLEIWSNLATKFKIDIFTGLFLSKYLDAFGLDHLLLSKLGERSLVLDVHLYGLPYHDH